MLTLDKLSLYYGGHAIMENVQLMIRPKDRIGLTGHNGSGKTTLLRLLAGEITPDKGQVIVPSGVKTGYLPQQLNFQDTQSLWAEAAAAFEEENRLERRLHHANEQLARRTDYHSAGYEGLIQQVNDLNEQLQLLGADTREQRIEQVLLGLGFERNDFQRPSSEFSGGWRMRLELAKLLLQEPHLLLLDEPINHLDILSIQWLERFLQSYPGALVIVAHDQDFMDNVTVRTLEISQARVLDYHLPYTQYRAKREEEMKLQRAAQANQEKKIAETQEFIERFRYKATKAAQVQSRIKHLEKMEKVQAEHDEQPELTIKFPPAPRTGDVVVKVRDLGKSYGDLQVLDHIDMTIERGEKVAFVGKNGAGKSTLVKIINGLTEYEGVCQLGHKVHIGYFAQDQPQRLDADKTVLETLDEVAVGDIRTKIRDILGAFLFGGEEIDKPVAVLSGGERTRLALARLLLEPYSMLILDEPTNHLDIRSKELLKQAINQYNGAVIVVSHDRHFIHGLVHKIYEFSNKRVREFIGSIYEYLQKLNTEVKQEINQKPRKETTKPDSENKQLYAQRKALEKKIRKVNNQLKKAENQIEVLEKEIAASEKILANPEGQQPSQSFFETFEQHKKDLERAMEQWEDKALELEGLKEERQKLI